MAKVNLPYGIDNFEQLRERNCYYIDKTNFIKKLLSDTFAVNLITRPRRFGKTLMMSMLSEFFDIRKDSKKLFEGLEITKDKDFCEKWMNKWPVLFLTLKDINGRTFDRAYGILKNTISKLCIEHSYLEVSPNVDNVDKETFLQLKMEQADVTKVQCALDTILRMMKAHYGQSVILLVDEYDVPLSKASDNDYYNDMLEVIRSLLGMVWKTNPNLQFAIVTGCLRIAKESIFTGANNFISNSISGESYRDSFGFTEEEVSKLLSDVGFIDVLPEMKKWYDGYNFGDKEMYCPWDVINHIRVLMQNPNAKPENYWLDTSHNNIIKRFIKHPDIDVTDDFEELMAGGVIQKSIREDLTYDVVHSSEDNLWSILYLTGYLTQAKNIPDDMILQDSNTALRIPNEEVKSVFGSTVKTWFEEKVVKQDRSTLFKAWWDGDADALTEEVTDILFDTISYFDYKEDFYHAFLAGLFSGAGYIVKTNSEQGTGRADIVITDRSRRRAIVIEAKWTRKNSDALEKSCDDAIEQINKKQYKKNLLDEGYKTVLCYGAAFRGKLCFIKLVDKSSK